MKLRKIITMGLASMMTVSAMSMSAMAAEINTDNPSYAIYSLSEEETIARGFRIIDEDIYDLNGNLVFDMENGMTPDGYSLDPVFRLITGGISDSNSDGTPGKTMHGFNDTDGHWAENTIEKWQDYGYISGYPDGSFKPDNPVTRAELAKILSSVFDLQQGEPLVYTDISDSDWFYPYLEKSARFIPVYALPTTYESNIPYRENETQNGNYFLPNVNAIRMHVAETLVKIKLERENTAIEDLSIQEINEQVKAVFKDPEYSNLSAMHGQIPKNVERMNRYTWLAHKLNIMVGDDEYFDPYGYITRAELLTAIDRMITVYDNVKE